MPCVAGDDHRLFFLDVSFEGNVPVMVVHLPFQLLPWRGNGAESREVASARPEAEPVDVRMIRLSQEKEIPGMADGGQDIHVVEISSSVISLNGAQRDCRWMRIILRTVFPDTAMRYGFFSLSLSSSSVS